MILSGLIGCCLLGILVGYFIGYTEPDEIMEAEHGALKHMLIVYSTSGDDSIKLSNYYLNKIKDDYSYHMVKYNLRRILDLDEEVSNGDISKAEYLLKADYHIGLLNEM